MRKTSWIITFTCLVGLLFIFASTSPEASAYSSLGNNYNDSCGASCHTPTPAPAPAPKAPASKPPATQTTPAAPAAPAYKTVNTAINGIETNILMLDHRAMLSARELGNLIGADVNWDNETQGISFRLEEKVVTMFLNKAEAKVNGSEAKTPVNAQTIDGNNMVPIRFVAESLGLTVHYTEGHIAIYQ